MEKITFTLCSLNYLSQALSLGDSLRTTNSQYHFVIGLVDRLDFHQLTEIDKSALERYSVIEVHNIGIENFEEMVDKYNITELNTAVKPFFFDYFFKTEKDLSQVIYFDPDILVYEPLTLLDDHLLTHNFVITPHMMNPINDSYRIGEREINNTGLYNLGFIAIKKTEEAVRFIEWWKDRLFKYCFIDFSKGLFVDQIWVNFLPLFFDGTWIEKDPAYNMSYWNLHERIVSFDKKIDKYVVNDIYPLKFYHFSGYLINRPNEISKYQNRFTFEQRADLVPLYKHYREIMIANHHNTFSKYKCFYIEQSKATIRKKWRNFRRGILDFVIEKLTLYSFKDKTGTFNFCDLFKKR